MAMACESASRWAFPFPQRGVLRMNSVQNPEGYKNLWDLPNLLLQKFPAEEFTATAKVKLTPRFEGERFGLVVMGLDYSYVGVTVRDGKLYVAQSNSRDADKTSAEFDNVPYLLTSNDFYLRVKVSSGAMYYLVDYLSETGYDPQFGARPLKRLIQKQIVNQLSKKILAGDIDKSHPVLVDVFDGVVVFRNEVPEKGKITIIKLGFNPVFKTGFFLLYICAYH